MFGTSSTKMPQSLEERARPIQSSVRFIEMLEDVQHHDDVEGALKVSRLERATDAVEALLNERVTELPGRVKANSIGTLSLRPPEE